MDSAIHNAIVHFVWRIAEAALCDLWFRGRCRGVVPLMTVLRRHDAVPGPITKAVLEVKAALNSVGLANQGTASRQTAGRAFRMPPKFAGRLLLVQTAG